MESMFIVCISVINICFNYRTYVRICTYSIVKLTSQASSGWAPANGDIICHILIGVGFRRGSRQEFKNACNLSTSTQEPQASCLIPDPPSTSFSSVSPTYIAHRNFHNLFSRIFSPYTSYLSGNIENSFSAARML